MNLQHTNASKALAAIGSAAALAALGATGLVFGAAIYALERMNRRPTPAWLSEYTFTPFETQIAGFEELTLTAEDGVRLSAWWLPCPGSQRVVIGLGGHHSSKPDMLGIGSALCRAGNNVLLFDWRSRGASQVAQHSLAYYELRDAEAALAYAKQRVPDASLGLVGFSMGASIALLLAAKHPEVRAVVADSPFTGIHEVVAHGVARYRLPASVVLPVADAMSHLRYGYRFGAVRPIDVVGSISPRPLLLVHGSADDLIPVQQAHALLAAAREPKQLWVYEGVDHCGAYFADRPGYCQRVSAFFDQYLGSVEAE
ncbi:alpha/beta fold hydrolase [Chloroflexia bacterium SDU3-3]|nr:alpha/beta fold hydrolase [Chloroflexia bacterium SDU3-3]